MRTKKIFYRTLRKALKPLGIIVRNLQFYFLAREQGHSHSRIMETLKGLWKE
jgi:spermidine synthase